MSTARVKLRWQDTNNIEIGHKIYRSDTPMDIQNMPTPIATLNPNTTEYTDEAVIEGNFYYYRVSAYTSNAEEYSNEVYAEAKGADIFGDGSAVSLFRFNGNANDEIINITGVWLGNEQYVSGVEGQAAKFDGNSIIELQNHDYGTLFDYTSRFTISYYVVEPFFSFGFRNSQGNSGLYYAEFSDGEAAHFIATANSSNGVGNRYNQINTTTPFSAGDHVVMSKIGNESFDIYKNGVLLRTWNMSNNGNGNVTSYVFGNGVNDYVGSRMISIGSIDHFRIFNRSITEQEAVILYNELI